MDARTDPQSRGTGPASAWAQDLSPRIVANGVVRFLDPLSLGLSPRPSAALTLPLADLGSGSDSTQVRVRWRRRTCRGGARRLLRISIPPGSDLYGLGEAAGPLRRNGRRLTLWNADHYAYDETTPSLYQAHPWVLGVRPDGTAFGVIWDTTCRSRVWCGDGCLVVRANDAGFPVYVIEAPDPAGVVSTLTRLTGRAELPPLWALGFQQSRYSYYPDAEVRRIADELRTRRIPCDVMWLDIHYMDGNRSFTFDPERFPDPRGIIGHLHERSLRSVLMIDPGLKVDASYHAYASGQERGAFVRDAIGREYHGQVWPGACAFPDFSNADVRRWWGDLYRPLMELGADGFWNDMNEPAIFDGPGRTMPESNVHVADPELGGPTTHARIHNVYGMLMVRATREGVLRHRPERRPFVLTRANFLGGHRFAATWTGDNSSTWEHLGWSITMALNLGLSGQPMAGPDIGGFEGNATGRLFARWMGIGAFMPFCRAHTDVWTREHEPWSWGPGVEATCRRAIMRRYRLLPYWYTLFDEAARSGLPPLRPLLFAAPAAGSLRGADDAFMLGDAVMVRCRTTEDDPCKAAFPPGTWHPFELIESHDAELPEMWLREGRIVPVGPALQHTGERSLDPLTLLVALDASGRARGSLYEDEGDGHAHRDGRFLRTTYVAERLDDGIWVRIEATEGKLARPERALRVELYCDGEIMVANGVDGEPLRIAL